MADVEQIYEQYFQDVYLFALSLSRDQQIAEEITQETFVKAVKNIDQFKGNCKISVWLCQIAKNTYFKYMDKQKRDLGNPQEIMQGNSLSMEQKLIDKTEALRIHKLLHGLKEPYKEVFTLRVFGELSFDHISEVFGRTESWARVTFHRARNIIQDLLMEENR
ncbi:RNA polymerase sigma factor [Paenibacillus riograndensis]|uniref:RNA polymerase subunit sigma n=2 Tax=Paenibacillus riograndensis TaxID=483937 RepID=A0A132TJ28_9BACL|nr:RNA polymerase sigma factor [Paenibacillus riograndensis]KWX71046.1 RNA polymerase subunit sigma [Paenibacillus riograndensis]CQR55535.1 Sigma-70 region 2 [Paenibacillus riograndensis SBR5]